jgi:4-amino-4-deoxy-L-arabinose transferase-like glycosyltransferase
VLIVLVGAGLRFYQIGELPPGLYRDEAFYGLDALRVLNGDLSLYFATNNGREGLFMYLLAASIRVLGRTPEALRIVPAIIGTFTLVGIYVAARNMFSHRVGVLSAGILAITFWHVALSRVAYRAILLPLALCMLMGFVFAALGTNQMRRRLVLSACAGVAFGACFYTYTSGQFALPLVILFVLSLVIGLQRDLFARRTEEDVYRRRMSAVVFFVAALVTLAPLLLWLTQHADLYLNRAGQVSIINPVINNGDLFGTLLNNIGKTIGMFAVEGDRIWRHNLSLRPVFDGFLAVAFFVGLGVCLWRWLRSWQSRYGSAILGVDTNVAPQFLLLWLGMFLVPTILAEDTPHFLRGIGALPAACIVAAVGLEAALAFASRRGYISGLTMFLRRVISPPAFIAAVVLTLSGINTMTDYFNDYVNRPITSYWLESQNVALAHQLKQTNLPTRNIWVEDRLSNDNPALAFLLGDAFTVARNEGGAAVTYTPDDIRVPLRNWAEPNRDVLLIVDPNRDWTPLRTALPPSTTLSVVEGPLAQADQEMQPRRAYVTVFAHMTERSAGTGNRFEQGIVMVDSVVQPMTNSQYQVKLSWTTTQPIPDDLAVFVHWMRGGQVLAQSDGTPASGYLPMPAWRPGDVIEDMRVLGVPGGAQPGDEIRAGIYRRGENVRLKTLDAQGNPLGDSVIISPP